MVNKHTHQVLKHLITAVLVLILAVILVSLSFCYLVVTGKDVNVKKSKTDQIDFSITD